MEEEKPSEITEQLRTHAAANQANQTQTQTKALLYQMEEGEKNLAETQLDVEQTLSKIAHLLKQDVLRINDKGFLDWADAPDQTKRVLTDEGVDKLMQIMQTYINKETLLSNFDEDTINRRMLEFSLALSALIFLKYEIFFRRPSIEEIKKELKENIQSRLDRRKVVCELSHVDFDEKKEAAGIMKGGVEKEMSKIEKRRIESNLKEFEMLFIQLRALVEATHQRAYKGEERGSLRRHFNITEIIGGGSQKIEGKKGGIFGWGRG